jgi:hypothetical protein
MFFDIGRVYDSLIRSANGQAENGMSSLLELEELSPDEGVAYLWIHRCEVS